MRRAHFGILACAVMALALLPGSSGLIEPTVPELTAPDPTMPIPTVPVFELPVQGIGIICEFECQDGTSLALDPCTDGSLAICCTNGEPACADHGGLAVGICRSGRLGQPCSPL